MNTHIKKYIKSIVPIVLAMSVILTSCGSNNKSESKETKQVDKETKQVAEETKQVAEETKQVAEETKQVAEETKQVAEETKQVAEETKQVVKEGEEEMITFKGTNFDKSLQLIDKISEEQTENIMFSPLSMNMALGLLQKGTEEGSSSADALSSYLDGNYEDFAKKYIENIEEFNATTKRNGYNTVFELANSVWVSTKYEINDEYKKGIEDGYKATADTIDNQDEVNSANKVNKWCNDNTHGLIKEIVNEDMMRTATSVLANTVYMESAWEEEWSSPMEEVKFPNLDGTTSDIKLMNNTLDTYYENDKARAFGAKYSNGLTFIGILPKQEGDFKLQDLNLQELIDSKMDSNIDVYASMPELEFDTEIKLRSILENTDLAPLFDDQNLDFTGICSNPIHVDEIIQKTRLELDRYGTKAAAVTAIAMLENMAYMGDENRIEEVILDRPFAFIIYDEKNNVPVFIGKITNMN